MPTPCDSCGRMFTNSGNLSNHKKRCAYMAPAAAAQVPFDSSIPPDANPLPFHIKKQTLKRSREVYQIDIVATSNKYRWNILEWRETICPLGLVL